jgi:hypothetical protein
MPVYYKPLRKAIPRGQRYGANPGWGPNPAGGHNGDDYLSQVGEPIYAAGDGEVIHAGTFDSTFADNWGWNLNFGGNMVVLNLDGPEGPYVEYGHMDEIHVKVGQRVRAGQVIGTTGETDGGTRVITGPHLHVGCLPPNFNLNTNTYGRVNPDLYLTAYWEGGIVLASTGTLTPSKEDEMSADMPLVSKDGAKVTLQTVLNSIDEKTEAVFEAVDSFPLFDAQVREQFDIQRALERDLRADLAHKGAQIDGLTAALTALASNQSGVTTEQVVAAIDAAASRFTALYRLAIVPATEKEAA